VTARPQPFVAGSAATEQQPATPKQVPHRGGEPNPSAAALQTQFAGVVQRVDVVWGETTIYVEPARVLDVVRWLHDDPAQRYDFLADVTCVEYRDPEQALEVVWHLRSLAYRRFLRLKAALPKGRSLAVPSVWPVYKTADWLEREAYDMFGIRFDGHPDLRRILLPEGWEGHPLRKEYPVEFRENQWIRDNLNIVELPADADFTGKFEA
jgi:NADH-quinone oxidoreductase subunit C